MTTRIMMTLAAVCTALTMHAGFKAGFSRVDATPPLGIPMVGHFHKRNATAILDPLCVECVAVSDGENTALVYSVDDLPDYQSYDYHDCPYCKAGRKVDALVNSFGYSSL